MAGVVELIVPAAGAALVLAGLGWSAWAAWCLARAPVALTSAGSVRVLVDHGPYAVGRHPVYLGALLAGLGAALASASIAGLVALALLFAALHAVVVPREEARLQRQYGGWYSDYAAEVPRWL